MFKEIKESVKRMLHQVHHAHPAIPVVGIYIPKRNKTFCPYKNLCLNVHNSIIHRSPKWKQPKCPSTNK